MAPLAIPAAIVGAALAGAGAVSRGVSANRAGKAQQALFNEDARNIERNTLEEEQSFIEGTDLFKSEQLATLGASGATIDTSSSPESYLYSGFGKKIGESRTGKGGGVSVETRPLGDMSTPLRTAIDTARRVEEDRLRLLRTGKEEAKRARAQGALARQQGRAGLAQGIFGMAGDLLSGTYNVAMLKK